MASDFFPLPEYAVYLDDKRPPYMTGWEWLMTLAALQARFAAAPIDYLSLDFNLDASDPDHDGLAVVAWMAASDNWPAAYLQLHTGDYIGRDLMRPLIEASGLFEPQPIEHPLGLIYKRSPAAA